jgi:hypothetical protein
MADKARPMACLLFVLGLLAVAQSQSKPEIELVGLKDHYRSTEKMQFSIRNNANRRFGCFVAIQAQFENDWVDVIASIDDPQHPLAVVAKGTVLRALETRTVDLNLEAALRQAEVAIRKPLPNRLRFSVRYLDQSAARKWTLKSQSKTVISQPFTVERK